MTIVKREGRRWFIPLIAISLVLIIFASYQWIIPRTDLEVRTVYHESPSGGGTGGVININVLMINKGNRRITGLDCMVIVRDLNGKEVGRNMVEEMDIGNGANTEISITVIGSQYNSYSINIDLDFETTGGSRERSIQHITTEDVMNLVFVNNIR